MGKSKQPELKKLVNITIKKVSDKTKKLFFFKIKLNNLNLNFEKP